MADTLKVRGGVLYYERRGSGPLLLLISGGPTDADVYSGLAPLLSDTYTVVTYDPRGNSRSTLDGSAMGVPVEAHAEDAVQLLAAVGNGPAHVFGNSGGAVIGLHLAAHHAGTAATLVAHEAPVVSLLPDAAVHRARSQQVNETYRREGVGPAMQLFLEGAGLKGGPPPRSAEGAPDPETIARMERMGRNVERFLAHGLQQAGEYVPDIAALQKTPTRVIIAAGEASGDQLAARATLALAERLRTPVQRFPGDHGGFITQPQAFAAKLREILSATS